MTTVQELAILAQDIRIIASEEDKKSLEHELLSPLEATVLAFANAHAFNLCWKSPEIRNTFSNADVLLRDGKGLEIFLKKAKLNPGLNMNGTDFIPSLLASSERKRIAVLGTRNPWLSTAVDRLKREGRVIVAQQDGFQPIDAYIATIQESQPDIVLLAQGMPRQEDVACALKAVFADQPMLIICGGAIVDFLADRFDRAPLWMQKAGLEWAYRLMREPKRLFERYVIGNVLFLLRTQKIVTAMHPVHIEGNSKHNG